MADYTQAQYDEAVAQATATGKAEGIIEGKTAGIAEGATAERARIEAILALDVSKARPVAALGVALDTEMTVEQADKFLGKLPEEGKQQASAPNGAGAPEGMFKAAMNGSDTFPPVRGTLGQLAAHAAMVSGLVAAQEQECEIDEHGVAWPGRASNFAVQTLQSEFYPKLLQLVRDLCGGGIIQLPSGVGDYDNPEAAADLERYVQSPGWPSEERVKLLKLVWDLVGSEFAGRHEQYEMFYAGAPFLVRTRMAQVYDFAAAGELVDRVMGGYDRHGRLGTDGTAA